MLQAIAVLIVIALIIVFALAVFAPDALAELVSMLTGVKKCYDASGMLTTCVYSALK